MTSGKRALQGPLVGQSFAHLGVRDAFRSHHQLVLRETCLFGEGQEFMLAQPEFQRNAGLLAELMETLTESEVLIDALSVPGETQTVTIGRENRSERLHPVSVVRRSFFVGENEAGVVALIGPTRMRYDTGIPLVTFTAQALSESLTRTFG